MFIDPVVDHPYIRPLLCESLFSVVSLLASQCVEYGHYLLFTIIRISS